MDQADTKLSERWLNIVDYAGHKRMSISTIRRYIKAKRLKYKMENGRYYILAKVTAAAPTSTESDQTYSQQSAEIRRLKQQVAELEMLVALYESGLGQGDRRDGPPELPKIV